VSFYRRVGKRGFFSNAFISRFLFEICSWNFEALRTLGVLSGT